jgi:hypothetical protein
MTYVTARNFGLLALGAIVAFAALKYTPAAYYLYCGSNSGLPCLQIAGF